MRIFFILIAALLTLSAAYAQTQSVLPNGMTQFVDGNGSPYAGGRVYMYVPKTTTPKPTYLDPYGKAANPNPITLDANGRAIIWGNGLYRQVLQDLNGVTVWDQPTLAPNPGSGGVGTAGISQYVITSYGAKCDGVTDDTAAIQSAITAAQNGGGGEVVVPMTATGCYLTGTLSITKSNVTLRGASLLAEGFQSSPKGGAFLTFANGAADDIDIGFQSGQINGNGVKDLLIDHVGKTGGTTISVKFTSYTTIDHVFIFNAFNGVWFNRINNAAITYSNINATVNGNNWGMQYNTTNSSASVRSDVLLVQNVVIQLQGASGEGFYVDGYSSDIHADHLIILGARGVGLYIDNSSGSSSYFPQFGYFNDLEIDAEYNSAVIIAAGNNWQFVQSLINSINDTNYGNPIFHVLPDTGNSETRQVYIVDSYIQDGPGECVNMLGVRDSLIVGSTLADCGKYAGANGLGGAQPAVPVLDIGSNVHGLNVTGNIIGFVYGQCCSGSNDYSVFVGGGATGVVLGSNNYTLFNGTTGTINNQAGATNVTITAGGLGYDGNQFSPYLQYGGNSGENQFVSKNPGTTGTSIASVTAATGTASAYVKMFNTDGATPTGIFACGSGDTGGCSFGAGAGNIIFAPPSSALIQIANAGSFVVNGANAGAFGNTFPNTVATSVSKWLLIEDNAGGKYVLPMFLCGGC